MDKRERDTLEERLDYWKSVREERDHAWTVAKDYKTRMIRAQDEADELRDENVRLNKEIRQVEAINDSGWLGAYNDAIDRVLKNIAEMKK